MVGCIDDVYRRIIMKFKMRFPQYNYIFFSFGT